MADTLKILSELEKKVLWLSSWMIHNANHLRENVDGLKVGGHQASSASLATIMTALYFAVLRPEDRVAVKPHASPVFHAIQYLLGNQSREKLENFRGYKGAQSYPSRTKDGDDVDFSTGSVGLGVAQTLFASLVQDYRAAHTAAAATGRRAAWSRWSATPRWTRATSSRRLLEGWKHGLRNTWWVIDYNRQSLDAVIREGLWSRFEAMFRNFGWDVVILKYGSLQEAAFAEPGGEALRELDRRLPQPALFGADLPGRRGLAEAPPRRDRRPGPGVGADRAALRRRARPADDQSRRPRPADAARRLRGGVEHDRPVCFIAYTIKGFGLPFAGHKDNHSGLMTTAQMETFRAEMGIREGHEWDRFEGLSIAGARAHALPRQGAVQRARARGGYAPSRCRCRSGSPPPRRRSPRPRSASARSSTRSPAPAGRSPSAS